jgi:hypothetical protein
MVSADKALDSAKWVGIGLVAVGAAYVLYRVVKWGESAGDAISGTIATAKAKAAEVVAYVKDPSQGRSYGSTLDKAAAQRDPLSPDYVPDWRERDGVTVNEYGDYGYGTGPVESSNQPFFP